MRYWQAFWTLGFLAASLAFAFVTLVVTLKGGRDLREMFSRLTEQKKKEEPDAGLRP